MKSKRPRAAKTAEQWLVLPDLQVPYHDQASLRAVLKYASKHRFDGLLIIGDFMDFDCISSHNKDRLREVEGKRIFKDYAIGNEVLDQIQAVIRKNNRNAKLVLLEGNHEYRLERYLDANPQMEGMIEVELGLRLKQRGFKWVRSWSKGDIYTIGKANFTHGQYTTQYHAAKMVNNYGDNIFYGHTHDVMTYSRVMRGRDKTIVGQSLGCLCNYELSYIKKNPTNWQQAFGVFYFLPSGHFTYYTPRIFNHKFVGPDGVLYEA